MSQNAIIQRKIKAKACKTNGMANKWKIKNWFGEMSFQNSTNRFLIFGWSLVLSICLIQFWYRKIKMIA